MRVSMTLAGLFLTASVTYAADWQYITKYSQAEVYIDKSSVSKQGKITSYWRMYKYFEPQVMNLQGVDQSIRTTKTLIEANCKANTYEGKSIQAYDVEGMAIGSSESEQGKIQVVPGSNIESELAFVCMFSNRYDKEQDDIVEKSIDSFFNKYDSGGMSGVEKYVKNCYSSFNKSKSKKDLERCLTMDSSAFFWNKGFMSAMNLNPDIGFFAIDKANSRISAGYSKLGYNEIQGEVSYTVLLTKINKKYPSKSLDYANK